MHTIVLHKEKNWAQPYVDHWIIADTNDHQESLMAVANFLKSNPNVKVGGVVTFWEDDVLLTSRISDKFNWIGIPYATAKNVRNKFLFREFCRKNGVKTPKNCLIRNSEDLEHVRKEFLFPVVVKPAYGSSSAYVVKAEDHEGLEEVYNYIKSNLTSNVESALHDGSDIVVEEYIDGDEVDIDILIQNGKIKYHSITDNFKTEEPFFVETGESIPSSLSAQRQEELLSLRRRLLKNSAYRTGAYTLKQNPQKTALSRLRST